MPKLSNRIQCTSTTTGTGAITVSATPVDGYRALSVLATGTVFDYSIELDGGTEFETGRGKATSSTTFSRDKVLTSSNSNALVNFSAGTKYVLIVESAESMVSRGRFFGTKDGIGVN
jgi:hypothetical protein